MVRIKNLMNADKETIDDIVLTYGLRIPTDETDLERIRHHVYIALSLRHQLTHR